MKKIVICAALIDESLELLKTLKGNPLLAGNEIHLVHCFRTEVYTNEFSAYIYPTHEKYPEIESSVLTILENLEKDIFQGDNSTSAIKKCFFHHSPKQQMREYLEEVKADMVIVATRGKHGIKGLFSSSFAEHLVKYSPCDIYILRPKES